MNTLVTVVIPTYNRADFILESVNSVLSQSFQDFEILIVDDGSTDDTLQIIQGLNNPRIRVLPQVHQGVSAALERGWQEARGKYIGRVDSDDVWLPTLLETLVPIMERDANVGVAYARAQGMDETGRPLAQLVGAPERFPGETLKSLLYGDFVTPMAVVIRRTAIQQAGGYDESLIGNEDWDLWIRIARKDSIAYVPEIRARYRFHTHNLTRTSSDRMTRLMQDRIRVLDKFFAEPSHSEDLLAIRPVAYRNVYLDWMIRALEARRWQDAKAAFWHARTFSPNLIQFLIRAMSITAFTLYLSKTDWGVSLTEKLVAQRRRNLAA